MFQRIPGVAVVAALTFIAALLAVFQPFGYSW
jgi:hypothetical protein